MITLLLGLAAMVFFVVGYLGGRMFVQMLSRLYDRRVGG